MSGAALLVELDADQQQMALANLPQAFHPKLVTASSPHFPTGFANAPIRTVLSLEHLWRPDLGARTRDWLALTQRYFRPGFLLAVDSPGGTGPLAAPPIEMFKSRYPHVPVYL